MANWWSRPSLDRALACAIAAHAVAALWVARPHAPSGNAPPPRDAAPPTLEIEVTQEPAGVRDEPTPAAPTPKQPPPEAFARAVIPAPARGVVSDTADATGAEPGVPGGAGGPRSGDAPAAASSAGTNGAGTRAPLSLEALGIGGRNQHMGTSHDLADPTRTEIARTLEKKIAEDLLVHDRALGLGADGPVIAALEMATSAGTAPVTGRAVFRVIADGDGTVTELVAVDVSESRGAWDETAARALRDLKGKKLRMPSHRPGAKGVAMHIEIVSAYKMPSGADPGTDVTVFHVPLKKGDGKKSSRVDLLDPIPKVVTVEPPADSTSPVKLPPTEVRWSIINLHGDLSDIGGRPRRIVHGRVLDEHLL